MSFFSDQALRKIHFSTLRLKRRIAIRRRWSYYYVRKTRAMRRANDAKQAILDTIT